MSTPSKASIAVIGGTGLNSMAGFQAGSERVVDTPYGPPSAALLTGTLGDTAIVFLPRHGVGHHLAPHAINYRANIWALREIGVQSVIAVAAVGSMREDFPPGALAIPEQLIDYTWGREHSFADESETEIAHIEFETPYDEPLRQRLLSAAKSSDVPCLDNGCYACTQGPRLETAAEVQRLVRDGNDMVGMTSMPEACLAREAGLAYACIAVSVNWAAGLGQAGQGIHAQIERAIAEGMAKTERLLSAL